MSPNLSAFARPMSAKVAAIATSLAVSTLAVTAHAAVAPRDPASQGEVLARASCSGCHAVGPTGASPRREAPPFRDLLQRRDAAGLQAWLVNGVPAGHPAMPQIPMWGGEAADLVAYLSWLAAGNGAPR